MRTFGRCLFLIVNVIQIVSFYIALKYELSQPLFNNNIGYPYTMMIKLVYINTTILSMLCYYRASFTDAGPIKIKSIPDPRLCDMLSKECDKCKAWKPPRAHHCKICKKCVFRMDHHCEWINNCVGFHNQKYFMLFLLYTFIQTTTIFIIVLVVFIYWLSSLKTNILVQLFNITTTRILIGGQLLLSIFFCIFTADFLYDQILCIIENQSTIESHKETYGRPGKFLTNLIQVFGKNKLMWLLPVKPQLSINYLELVYHYEYVVQGTLFLEDQFENKENKHYELFQKYLVNQD